MSMDEVSAIMIDLLERLEEHYSQEYTELYVNGQRCFTGKNGTVFYIALLRQFRCVLIEYADNIQEAQEDHFDDGDLVPIDQPFMYIIAELNDELEVEAGGITKAK